MKALKLKLTLPVVLAALLAALPAQATAVQIDDGPAEGSAVQSNSVEFRFSNDKASMFWCSFDGESGEFCSPWEAIETSGRYGRANLSEGTHTFYVSATTFEFEGGTGSPIQSTTYASRTFTVDTRPPSVPDTTSPDTLITKAPAQRVRAKRSANVKVEFSSTEPNSTFTCQVDGGAVQACSSPASFRLRKVKHTISIAATDAAGNTDSTPATVEVEVKKKHKQKHG